MIKSILSIFFAATLSLVISIVIFPAYPVMAQATIYVPDDHATIQEAINAADDGDTVYVRPGTYTEYIIITKPLTLEGEDRDTTIIQALSVPPAINIQGTINVIINNLTIKNDGREGVYILNSSDISLMNNNISGFYRECVKVESSTDISIVGNSINASTRTGMTLISTNDSNFSNNMIFNNDQHGINLYLSNNNTFTGNTICNNERAGIFFVSSSNNEVYNNNFINNKTWQVCISGGQDNKFNLAKPVGGNYWSNWTTPDVDPVDGFVDDYYYIGGGFWDNLPWAQQDGWKNSPATVDIEPDTLNLDSKGKWITCYIELEESYDVADIDISTIKLNGTVPAEEKPTGLGDCDDDGIPDLMVKFDRDSVQGILEVGDEVEIVITGELDGTSFKGTDTIRVIDKGND